VDNEKLNDELLKFNLLFSDINYQSDKSSLEQYIEYYIPVKRVYNYQTGKCLFSYPEISKSNIIDILIVNNKTDLYFMPGEKIIIPIDKSN
jgi:hypothetical protein